MKRLTRKDRNNDGTGISKESLIDRESDCLSDYARSILTKLADYEDAEEQGLLLKLPCAVGDTVYQCMIVEVDEKRKLIYKIFAAKVFKYSLDSYALCFWTETKDNFKYRNEMPLSAFGKFVFLTKEEAEAALAEMEK